MSGEVVVRGKRMGRTRKQSKSGHWIGWSIWRGSVAGIGEVGAD